MLIFRYRYCNVFLKKLLCSKKNVIAEQLRSLNICLVISVYFKYIICNNHMNHTTARKRNREHTDLNGFHLVSLKYNIILIDTSLRDAGDGTISLNSTQGTSILLFLISI